MEPPARHNGPENVDDGDTEHCVHPEYGGGGAGQGEASERETLLEILAVKLSEMLHYFLRLLLNDSLQPGLSEPKIFEMFESKPPLFLPQLAVSGDDSLQLLV